MVLLHFSVCFNINSSSKVTASYYCRGKLPMKRIKSQKCPQNSFLPSHVAARIKIPDLLCYQLDVFFPKTLYKFCQMNPKNLTLIMSLAT